MPDTLIERVAAAVAAGYRDLPLQDAAGLLLAPSWGGEAEDLAPLALELTEVDEDVDRDGYQEELGMPAIADDPSTVALCEELNTRLREDDDGHVLIDAYWLALADRVHALLGIPVLVHESEMPIAEQLRRQAGERPEDDPLEGMDVLVSVRIDAHRVAAVILRDSCMFAFGRVGDPHEAWAIGPGATEVSRDPQMLAGMMPLDATEVVVQDRKGTWHEAAVGRGAWLCVLPQRSGQKDPPFEYRGRLGARVEPGRGAWVGEPQPEDLTSHEAHVRAGAVVRALWPKQANLSGFFSGWEGPRDAATALRFVAGEWVVRVSAGEAPAVADAFVRRLLDQYGYGLKGAQKHLRDIAINELPGSVDGRAAVFSLAAPAERWRHQEGWVAVVTCEGFAVTVQCGGTPPERLDLVPVL